VCGYYKRVWSKAKALLNKGKIARFYVSNGTITIKLNVDGNATSILHEDDFLK